MLTSRTGNLTYSDPFSYNLLKNIGNLLGAMPYIRVGGLTQDFALYNASLKTATNGTYDPDISCDYPSTLYIGPSFFESYETWPGVKYSHGFNLALGANSSEGWQALVDTIPLACKALAHGKLYAWEYGNEPNNYASRTQGDVRPPTWNESTYVWQWLNGTDEIRRQVQKHCPDLAFNDRLEFLAPSYDDRVEALNSTIVWEDGLDTRRDISVYAVHK